MLKCNLFCHTKIFSRLIVLIFGIFSILQAQDLQLVNINETTSLTEMEQYWNNLQRNYLALTSMDDNLVPAAVTKITSEMLKTCGARRIDEALEIFVPSLQIFRHNFAADKTGIRGLVLSKFNKILFLVNGRIINDKFSADFLSGLDLPLLDEIKYIEVIRGPGSATLGPGAVAGVVSITTFDGSENDVGNFRTKVQIGTIENYQAIQSSFSKDLNIGKLFISGGISHYMGASNDYSPLIAGDYYTHPNVTLVPGEEVVPLKNNLPNDRVGLEPIAFKVHSQLTTEHTQSWLRVERGGEYFAPRRGAFGNEKDNTYYSSTPKNYVGAGYFTVLLNTNFDHKISDKLQLKATASTGKMEYSRQNEGYDGGKGDFRVTNQETHFGQGIVTYNLTENNRLGFGSDLTIDAFGGKVYTFDGVKNSENFDTIDLFSNDRFYYVNLGIIPEYQGTYLNKLSLLANCRFDYHTYAGLLFSPRIALTKELDDKTRIKLIGNRSNRINNGDVIRKEENRNLSKEFIHENGHEVINTAEIRYEWDFSKNWQFESGAYVNRIQIIDWNNKAKPQGAGAIGATEYLGDYDAYGWEMEAKYFQDKNRFALSHAYYKLIEFRMKSIGQDFTAAPYGFGDDLTNWSPHETKFNFHRQLNRNFGFDGSLRCFWEFPGQKDWSQYNREMVDSLLAIKQAKEITQTEYTSSQSYYGMKKSSIYMNAGCEYLFTDLKLKTRVDLQNMLGWLDVWGVTDMHFNKRNYIKRTADFRDMAPAISFTLTYTAF